MKARNFVSVLTSMFLIGSFLVACSTSPSAASQLNTPTTSELQQVPMMTAVVGTAVQGGSQSQPVPTDTPPAVIAGMQTITMADNGKTLTLQPEQRFVLLLGDGYQWTVDISDPTVISMVPGLMPVRGSQGVFVAHKTGQTSLSASGDPPCRSARPACEAPSILFELTIIVK